MKCLACGEEIEFIEMDNAAVVLRTSEPNCFTPDDGMKRHAKRGVPAELLRRVFTTQPIIRHDFKTGETEIEEM